jgi:hypothetical protein
MKVNNEFSVLLVDINCAESFTSNLPVWCVIVS